MKKNIEQFVNEVTSHINEVNEVDMSNIKEVVRKAISYYELKSYEEREQTKQGTSDYLYIHSMIEENMLSKIVTRTINDGNDHYIEEVYQGCVIRRH
ncbi:DUF6407 family protein [Alkalihalobacterium elongatum]|uniref:DUF6407 family protein n=1 Tax=Alkalihalobacterium elongatum TaxID=2675466 RepID=UPI001C1F60B1|nr:DUF6407 family protein [Alkalihalobacterium elongatum]